MARSGRGSAEISCLQAGSWQGWNGSRLLGRSPRDRSRSPRLHDQALRPGPHRGILGYSRNVDYFLRCWFPIRRTGRWNDAVVLRLVRRPSACIAAGVWRPDRRSGSGRLVQLRLLDHVGIQHPADPYSGRSLHDRGSLPRSKGRRRFTRLRRQHEVCRRVAPRRSGH